MQFELPFGFNGPRVTHGEWLALGGKRVPVRLVRNRRARRYVLRLARDGAARLTIPRGGSAVEARKFAERHLAWLEKQLLRYATQPAQPATWTDGTEILFRGERVRLIVQSAAEEPAGGPAPNSSPGWVVRFAGESVPVPEPGGDLRPAVEAYLRRLATGELTVRVLELAAVHGSAMKRVSVRNQRSRWGSCSRQRTISLNWRLVQTPALVRDYIILHELAHLKEMNHSAHFWREVARLCPGFEAAERWLKQNPELLR